jgi:hypothetical protein
MEYTKRRLNDVNVRGYGRPAAVPSWRSAASPPGRWRSRAASGGAVGFALSLCAVAHPLYTRFSNILGASAAGPNHAAGPDLAAGGRRQLEQDLLDRRAEAHIQHLVGLVEHQRAQVCAGALSLSRGSPPDAGVAGRLHGAGRPGVGVVKPHAGLGRCRFHNESLRACTVTLSVSRSSVLINTKSSQVKPHAGVGCGKEAHRRRHFLCLIAPLCSYLYAGLYGGCMRAHIIRYFRASAARKRTAEARLEALGVVHCPGRKPPFWAAKRPARPYKTAIQNQFTVRNATAA